MLKCRWLGTAGIELTTRDQTILIDPYFSRISKIDIIFGRPSPNADAVNRYIKILSSKISAIIIGHTHFDHAMDVPVFAGGSDTPILGSSNLDALLNINNQPKRVRVCKENETVQLSDSIYVTMIPSAHGLVAFGRVPYRGEINPDWKSPLKVSQYRLGTVFIPKLEVSGITLLHVGSANFVKRELEGHRCDILFMCIPGWKKIPAYTTQLPAMVQPEIIVPIHFDDFTTPMPRNGNPPLLPFLDMKGFLENISRSAPNARVMLPSVFKEMAF